MDIIDLYVLLALYIIDPCRAVSGGIWLRGLTQTRGTSRAAQRRKEMLWTWKRPSWDLRMPLFLAETRVPRLLMVRAPSVET